MAKANKEAKVGDKIAVELVVKAIDAKGNAVGEIVDANGNNVPVVLATPIVATPQNTPADL